MCARVKVMLAYDCCQFEIEKSTSKHVSNEDIDEMRKDCMRLADKAISQYKRAKEISITLPLTSRFAEQDDAERKVREIEKKAEDDRTKNELLFVKAFKEKDWERYVSGEYDYQDDFSTF